MKKAAKYISVFIVLSSLSFAGPKDKGLALTAQSSISFNQSSLIEDDGATVERKRAHKRKRRIRPRRNGF